MRYIIEFIENKIYVVLGDKFPQILLDILSIHYKF